MLISDLARATESGLPEISQKQESELPFAHNTVASIYFLLYIMLSFISTGIGLYCDRKDATRGVQRRKAQTVFRTFGSGL